MANQSIYAGFERMWQHTSSAIGAKADKEEVVGVVYTKEDEGVDSSAPVNADTLGGRPADDYATQAFVTNKIAEAQLGGGEGTGGEGIDLSGYATKDDLAKVLPISGGALTGALKVGEKVALQTDSEGGNIRLNSPDGKVTDFWEMDSSDGEKFRIFAYKNATHPNGEGYVMPLYLYSDGSIDVGNAAKTRERLGITADAIGARPNTWLPSAQEIGAVAAARTNLAGMSVKNWAMQLTTPGTFYGITSNDTTDLPSNLSGSKGYAIVTATVGAPAGWIELRATSVLNGYTEVCVYNYGWGEWKSANALASHEYGSTLPSTVGPAGSVFYKKV